MEYLAAAMKSHHTPKRGRKKKAKAATDFTDEHSWALGKSWKQP